jgi:hypothetical protein
LKPETVQTDQVCTSQVMSLSKGRERHDEAWIFFMARPLAHTAERRVPINHLRPRGKMEHVLKQRNVILSTVGRKKSQIEINDTVKLWNSLLCGSRKYLRLTAISHISVRAGKRAVISQSSPERTETEQGRWPL